VALQLSLLPHPSSHSKFGPFCSLIQRRLGCRPARMRQTSPNLCGPSAQPLPCPSSHSKFGLFCRMIQRRLGCRPARMRQRSPNLCGPSAQPPTSPVVAFQIRTVLSYDPETTRLPSCENATEVTKSVWPFSSASYLARRRIPNSDRFVV
jgi:hypothetical protein